VKETSDNRITLNLFSAFGPQRPIKLHAGRYETLENVKRFVSRALRISIHGNIVLASKGRGLDSGDGGETLERLDARDGDSLTVGLYTPPLPSEWGKVSKAIDVEVEEGALVKCREHAAKHPLVEVAGLLIGKETGEGRLLIKGSTPVAEGDESSVELDPVRVASVAEHLRGGGEYLVGWYHSHLSFGPSMSKIDARLQMGYQQLYGKSVAAVLYPSGNAVEFYRVETGNDRPLTEDWDLSMPEAVTLTTVLEEREEAKITAFSGRDALCGQEVELSVAVTNIGTAALSRARVDGRVTSPDRKESLSVSSDLISLSPGESKTCSLRCPIPASWPSGGALAYARVRALDANTWISPPAATTITLLQPPAYRPRLMVYKTSQRLERGQTARYAVYVRNDGNRRDEIEVNWDLRRVPEAWTASMYDGIEERTPPFSLTLEPGATYRLVLEVTPPATGYGGASAPVTIGVRSLRAPGERPGEVIPRQSGKH